MKEKKKDTVTNSIKTLKKKMLHINKILKKWTINSQNFDTGVLVVLLALTIMFHTTYQQKIESQQQQHHKMFSLTNNVI